MSRMVLLLSTAIGLTGLVGCIGAVNEDNWTKKSAKAYCKFNEECYLSYFQEEWDNVSECVDDFEDDYEDYVEDYLDDCDFESDKAKECLESLREATKSCEYDDIDDDCYEVWDC